MRHSTGYLSVHVMAWRLLGAKPLPEPLMTYCRLEPWDQILVEISLRKMHLKFSSAKCGRFVSKSVCYNQFKTQQISIFPLTFGSYTVSTGRGEVLVITPSVPCEALEAIATALCTRMS